MELAGTRDLHLLPSRISHTFRKLKGPNVKPLELKSILFQPDWQAMILFVPDATTLAWAVKFVKEQGLQSAAVCGTMSEATRRAELARFQEDRVNILICTDIAARGLDLPQVPFGIANS